jgi:hypothetical protein
VDARFRNVGLKDRDQRIRPPRVIESVQICTACAGFSTYFREKLRRGQALCCDV